MVKIEQIKEYILQNKSSFTKEKINFQLEKTGISKEMITTAWDEIEKPDKVVKINGVENPFETKKSMPISDIISWIVIILILIGVVIYYFVL